MEMSRHHEPAPEWVAADIAEFGRGLGLSGLALSLRGTAAVAFENGLGLALEWHGGSLCLYMTCPADAEPDTLRRLLTVAHPRGRWGGRLRAGYAERQGRAALLVVLAQREISVPRLNAAFEELWQAMRSLMAPRG